MVEVISPAVYVTEKWIWKSWLMKKLDLLLKRHNFSKKYTIVLQIQRNDPKNYSKKESLHLLSRLKMLYNATWKIMVCSTLYFQRNKALIS